MMNWAKRSLVIALLMVVVVAGLRSMPNWAVLTGRVFDSLSTLAPLKPDEPGIAIVAIDEPSMAAFGEQWPWKRERHAELIAALRKAGAKAIAFDVVFAEPTNTASDKALTDVGGEDIVFAADESLIERDYGTSLIVTEPQEELLTKGTKFGIASLSMVGDGVLRNMPRYENGFMATLLAQSGGKADVSRDGGNLIQYFGGAGTYPTVSYYQALNPDEFLPPDYFKGQTVIIGYALQANADVNTGLADAFETPFTASTNMLTPGVEVQATIFDNFRLGLSIKPAAIWVPYVLILVGALLGLLASRPKSPLRKVLVGLLFLGLLIFGSWFALRYGRIWLSPVEPIAALIAVVAAVAARDFTDEQRRRKEVQAAFGQYISPDMVARIVRDPSLLNLGGERREMTILFADIRGFTSISETMKDNPQKLTKMINDILTPLSDIVMKHGGTIDKYMGDCTMAFWNAPLDDPEHALHAVQAGQEMLAAMDDINLRLQQSAAQDEQIPEVRIGIGINSGDCVVGNMGSERRFDYSVLGDAVNVASRLEGLCKQYNVAFVVGEHTAKLVNGEIDLLPIDRIAVRGRTEKQSIYTLF